MAKATPGAAVAPRSERHRRTTQFIRAQVDDVDTKALEATRVVISAIFRDLSASRTSTIGLEPFTLQVLVPVPVEKPAVNSVGIISARDYAQRNPAAGDRYKTYPGDLAQVLAYEGSSIVEVTALYDVLEWADPDYVEYIGALLFPDDLIPPTGPNWLPEFYQDERHTDLFRKVEKHLATVKAEFDKKSKEYQAISSAELMVLRGRNFVLGRLGEMSSHSHQSGGPHPFDPKALESLWLRHLGMSVPAWGVQYDAHADAVAEGPTPAERALFELSEALKAQALATTAVAAQAPDISATVQAMLDANNRVWEERFAQLLASQKKEG